MTHIIESPDGAERQRVLDLAGYDGWRVIASGVPDPPHDHHHWDERAHRWVEDAETHHRERRRVARSTVPQEDLVGRIIALEDALVQALAALAAVAAKAGMGVEDLQRSLEAAKRHDDEHLPKSPFLAP